MSDEPQSPELVPAIIRATLAQLAKARRPDLILRTAETEGSHPWPDDAAFLLIFPYARFGNRASPDLFGLPHYYATDGWPCGFPEELKSRLTDTVKIALIIYPRPWPQYTPYFWSILEDEPGYMQRTDAMIEGSAHLLGRLPSPPTDDSDQT